MAAFTEEQTMIKDQAKSWVMEQAPVQKFRELRDSDNDTGFTADTWSAMVDMGWTGIIIPEQYGGSNLGNLTFGVVLEETGRQLTASPLLASALVGASAILLGGSEAQKQAWLPKIVDGSAILTLAVDETPRHAPEQVALQAEKTGDGFTLTGSKTFVMEGGEATALIVAARSSGSPGETHGITLFVVPADSSGITRTPLKTADSRGYANVDFKGVKVDADAVLGDVDEGHAVLDATLDRARAGLAAEMLGTAAQAFDMTMEYLKTRKQFGQVIGSFQALGHRAAGLFTEMELARSCVEAALQGIDSGAKDIDQLCSLSKCKAGDFLHHASNELIQIHGGIGMTDEFDAGFYLKRARAVEAAFGNQAFHRNRYAKLLGF
jgi:alkylation response protein AidB-like acyl-CoA dehydrogenase|tara:strand:+ start:2696 stop:3832 length:1137 start_codon:yes stop_codon:yes gene_type:complete